MQESQTYTRNAIAQGVSFSCYGILYLFIVYLLFCNHFDVFIHRGFYIVPDGLFISIKVFIVCPKPTLHHYGLKSFRSSFRWIFVFSQKFLYEHTHFSSRRFAFLPVYSKTSYSVVLAGRSYTRNSSQNRAETL